MRQSALLISFLAGAFAKRFDASTHMFANLADMTRYSSTDFAARVAAAEAADLEQVVSLAAQAEGTGLSSRGNAHTDFRRPHFVHRHRRVQRRRRTRTEMRRRRSYTHYSNTAKDRLGHGHRPTYSGSHSNTAHHYKPMPKANKLIHLLGDVPPPAWPSRLGTVSFQGTANVIATGGSGFSEMKPSGDPVSSNTKVSIGTQAEVEVPFNMQLENVRFSIVPGSASKLVENFDREVASKGASKGGGIDIAGKDGVDFSVTWDVSVLTFAQSIPVVAKHAYIGFGQDSQKAILDLGMAFYSCVTQPTGLDKMRECTYQGMLNFETEGNWPSMGFRKIWPQSPSANTVPTKKRASRCRDKMHMCDGQQEFSGLIFKEKAKGNETVEYSGEALGAGGAGDDSFMFMDLDGLADMGVTHAVLTGHEFRGQPLSALDGAFVRISAGEITGPGQGSMEMVLYQDLDEVLEPPSPPNEFDGVPSSASALVVGMLQLRSASDWKWGAIPKAANTRFWEYTMLNQPIDGKMLSESEREVKNILEKQLVVSDPKYQDSLNTYAEVSENLKDSVKMAEELGVDQLYSAYPGGLPGSASRNWNVAPERTSFEVRIIDVKGLPLEDGEKAKINVYWAGKKVYRSPFFLVEGGSLYWPQDLPPVVGMAPFTNFPLELHIWGERPTVFSPQKHLGNLTLGSGSLFLNPAIYTAGMGSFEEVKSMTSGTISVTIQAKAIHCKW